MAALIVAVCLISPIAVPAQDVNFDFEDAELRAVIQAVAEFTGKNFLVDPRVKGKVTVVAPTPLSKDEAYKVFQSVLEVNGFVTIESDGAIKIVPAEEGKSRNTGVYRQGKVSNRDDMVTRVIRLEHVAPERMLSVLRPLVASYGHMAADSSSLIITDRAANVDRLVTIIDRLDRATQQGEVEVIPMEHAAAEDIAQMLTRLYQQETAGGQQKEAVEGTVVMADPRTNSLVVRADVSTRREIRLLARDLDTPSSGGGDTHVIYLSNADAENLVEVLQSTVDSGDQNKNAVSDRISIKADPQTNALIVRGSMSDFSAIKQVIEKLDVRRLQVYVEALIAEVSTDNTRELGIQLQTAEGLRDGNRGVVGGSNFNVGTSIQDVLVNPLATGAGLSLGFIDGTVTLPDGTEVSNLAVLARALEGQSDANVLSTPNILTMDNSEAEIVVGQNVPFVTGSYSQINQGTAVQNPFQTIERRDVGLTLRIRPQITEGSSIKMEIFQEVSSVAQRGEAQDIVTNTRSLQTTVVAENNRMLVLGGLIQDDIKQNRQKVPLLGDIPVLGNLFRYQGKTRTKTNLLVFLRPRIIRASADMDTQTRSKYDYLNDLRENQDLLDDNDERPPLKEWERIAPSEQEPAAGGDREDAGGSR